MDRLKNALRRDFWILLLDVVAVNVAYFLALAFRVAVNNMGGIFGSPSDVPVYYSAFYRIAPIYTVLCIVVFFLFKLYGGVWRFAGINDMYRILGAWVVTILLQIIVSFLCMRAMNFNFARMPATYYMLGSVLQLLFMTAIRFGPKTIADEKRRRAKKAEKALVIGAGELGQQTVKMLQSGVNYDVSFIVDTEDEHIGLLLDGIPVFGFETLETLLAKNEIRCVFLAEPDLTKGEKAKVAGFCRAHGIELKERMFDTVDKNEPMTELQLHFKDPAVREKADKWLYFGLEAKSGYENSVAQKWWEFDISAFGHRAIMNNVTAAMAIEQFKKLPVFMEKREAVHNAYNEGLSDLGWMDLPLPMEEGSKSSFYFYHIQIKNGKRDELARYLRERDIYTTYRYFPLHRVPHYGIGGSFPGADYAADNTLCLPMHQSLTNDEVQMIIDKIKEFGNKYC